MSVPAASSVGDGVRGPKRIFASSTGDLVVDALTNRLHAAATVCEGDLEAAIAWVQDEMEGQMNRAVMHFRAEQERDDFCPEGVRVEGRID